MPATQQPCLWFWRAAAVLAPLIAMIALAPLFDFVVPTGKEAGTHTDAWPILSPLRITFAPPCAIAFFLAGLFAPTVTSRVALLGAVAIEGVAFFWVALLLLGTLG